MFLFFKNLFFTLLYLSLFRSNPLLTCDLMAVFRASIAAVRKLIHIEKHFIFPSVHRLYLVSVSHVVRHCVHGMSDKHIILIASRCYYLMLPRAQVTAGGQ